MSCLLALRIGLWLMEQYPAIYKTTLGIISHCELCGRAQVPKMLQK